MSDEIAVLETEATTLAARIPLIKIVDAESFALAVEDRAEIKRRQVRIHEVMDPICASTYAAWKTSVEKRDGLLAPYAEADKAYSRGMGVYEQAQARLRLEAERAAERERQQLEAEERARVAAEERRLRTEEEERRLTRAVEAEAVGDVQAAERILAEPILAPVVAPRPVFVPPVEVQAPKAAGVSFRDNWTAEVTDLLALVGAVAGRQQPITLLLPNTTALNQLARALKGAMNVPGVRAVNERIAAQRGS